MEIKAAELKDFDRVVEFYDNIIDEMEGAKYHPLWQKRIYPTLDFLKESKVDIIHALGVKVAKQGCALRCSRTEPTSP